MRCLIVGTGSVGTVLAAYLVKAGHDVACYVRPSRRAEYESAASLSVQSTGRTPSLDLPRPAITDQLNLQDVDVLFLCVKHPALPGLLEQLPATLPQGLALVPCLNGVGLKPKLRKRFPGTEIAQLTIMFNARVEQPLSAILTTKPEVQFNTNNRDLLEMFDGSGIVMGQVDDAAEWGKLLINLNNAVCGASYTTFKDLLTNKVLTGVFVKIMDEAIAVYEAANVRYTLPVPVPYKLYRWILLNGGPIAWWIARFKNGLTDQAYPSMAADITAGRKTEIEHLNGVIQELGRVKRIPTPANDRLISLIHQLEAGERKTLSPEELSRTIT